MSNSETILSAQTHPGDSTTETVTGEKYRGDGYYGRSDGFHTVQVSITGFIGQIEMQGTLAIDPAEADWFTVELGTGTMSVDTTGALAEQNITSIEYTANTTNVKSYNFTGNYVWVRAKISNWTDGTVNSIKLNH
jgi:hypothetical protein